eukprot:c16362_g1_i1 orf=239-616(-)
MYQTMHSSEKRRQSEQKTDNGVLIFARVMSRGVSCTSRASARALTVFAYQECLPFVFLHSSIYNCQITWSLTQPFYKEPPIFTSSVSEYFSIRSKKNSAVDGREHMGFLTKDSDCSYKQSRFMIM